MYSDDRIDSVKTAWCAGCVTGDIRVGKIDGLAVERRARLHPAVSTPDTRLVLPNDRAGVGIEAETDTGFVAGDDDVLAVRQMAEHRSGAEIQVRSVLAADDEPAKA